MTSENTDFPTSSSRPLGYWLRAVDLLIEREFAQAFADEGVSRRDWRILSVLAGDVEAPELLERIQNKKLRRLVERGWVTETEGEWVLTDEGRAATERLGELVAGIRARVSGSVPDEDVATTLRTLEAIARELGWTEETAARGFGPGRRGGFGRGRGGFGRGRRGAFGRPCFGPGDFRAGFGRGFGSGDDADGFGHRFGPGFGLAYGRSFGSEGDGGGFGDGDSFGPRHPFFARGSYGPGHGCYGEHDGHAHHGHHAHTHGHRGHGGGHRRGGRDHNAAQRAYERGFDAGFTRGRDAA
ncbi:MarR family winged helix-turn-helix transcriptional regulator [Microbacterium sp. MC2]